MSSGSARNLEMRTTGEKLRRLCGTFRVTPYELAKEMEGVSKSTIYNWCNDVSVPDIKSARLLANRFGVSLDYLADDAQDEPLPPSVSQEEERLLSVARSVEGGIAEALRRIVNPGAPPAHVGPPEYARFGPTRDVTTLHDQIERDRDRPTKVAPKGTKRAAAKKEGR